MGFNIPNDSPIPPVRTATPNQRGTTVLTSTPRVDKGACLNTSDPSHNRGKANILDSFIGTQVPQQSQQKLSKGSRVKKSQSEMLPQPGTSSQSQPVNTGRPQVHCSACGGKDQLRKDCHQDVFCTKCRTKSHATEMCHAMPKAGKENTICVYCGSTSHVSSRCTSRPNNNREKPRATPRELQENSTNVTGKKCSCFQNRDPHHQVRFNERYNRQYPPMHCGYQPSPIVSVPGWDLSTTLIELANIQSRSPEIMAASQRNQQEAFHELTRVSKDKANDAMFTTIKTYNGENRQAFEDWIDKID